MRLFFTHCFRMNDEQSFDALQAEKNELDLLIDRGVEFTTPRMITGLFSKKKERVHLIQQPYLGTLDRLSAEFIQMDFSETRLKEDPMNESKRLTLANARRCARIVAIAVLNNEFKIRFLTSFLTWYLLWRVTPSKLLQLTLLINSMSNVGDFTASIRLLSVARTTAPDRIEKAAEGPKA